MDVTVEDLRELERAVKNAYGRLDEKQKHMAEQLLDLAQRGGRKPIASGDNGLGAELCEIIAESDGFDAMKRGSTPSFSVQVPARLVMRNAIVNPAPGTTNPLVQPDRGEGIVAAPQQRLTIRGLFRQIPTSSNMIERPSEATFTNAAAPQGGDASPTGSGEGAAKAQSAMTFTLAQTPIVTIAHWINASRQILGDSPLLQAHIEGRLLYGLNLEEEQEFLTGTGAAGEVNGINNNAASFTGGSTNQSRIDTLAKAANQLAVGNYEPSGFVLHPTDWLAVQLEKDTQGRYILGDPGAARMPMIWGLPVVPTPSQTLGRFTVVDAIRFGYVADRETASVRISENVNDDFVRNIVTILAEKRTTLVVELGAAAVYGSLTNVG